jgi:hypothetical protein
MKLRPLKFRQRHSEEYCVLFDKKNDDRFWYSLDVCVPWSHDIALLDDGLFYYSFCDDANYLLEVGKYETLDLAMDAAYRYERVHVLDMLLHLQGKKMKLPVCKGHNYAGF